MKITVIIPVFNELKTIRAIIDKILNLTDLDIQIILVDDFSTDGTRELIENELSKKVDKVVFHSSNQGKGSAIISANSQLKVGSNLYCSNFFFHFLLLILFVTGPLHPCLRS